MERESNIDKENHNPNFSENTNEEKLLFEIINFCKGDQENIEEEFINNNLDRNFFCHNLSNAIEVNFFLNNKKDFESEIFFGLDKKFILLTPIGNNKKLFHFSKIFIFENIIYLLSEKQKKFNQFFFNFNDPIFGIYENGIYINFHSKMINKKIFSLNVNNFFEENFSNKKNYPKLKVFLNDIGFKIKNKDEFLRISFKEDFFINDFKYKLLFKIKKNKTRVNIKCFDFTDTNLLLQKRYDLNLFLNFFKRHKKFFKIIFFNNDKISLQNYENLINFLISEKITFFNLFCISNYNHFKNYNDYFLFITNRIDNLYINEKFFKGFIFNFDEEDIFLLNEEIFLKENKDFDYDKNIYGLRNSNIIQLWNAVLKIELFNN